MIRNSLASVLATVIVLAYLGGTFLFWPWGPAVVAVLSGGGITGPAVFKKIALPREPTEPNGAPEAT